jgi:hypothetical protein
MDIDVGNREDVILWRYHSYYSLCPDESRDRRGDSGIP